MQLPAVQYGDWKTVKARLRKVVNQVKRGAPFIEAITADGMLDAADRPGLLLIDGPNPVLGSGEHFHCFGAARLLREALHKTPGPPTAAEDEVFAASLTTPWGVLGLFGRNDNMWLWPETRYQPFLDAALASWTQLDALGPRFSSGLDKGQPLWTVPNNLHYVLANLGVPADLVRAPLPPDGPAALLRYTARPQ